MAEVVVSEHATRMQLESSLGGFIITFCLIVAGLLLVLAEMHLHLIAKCMPHPTQQLAMRRPLSLSNRRVASQISAFSPFGRGVGSR